MRKSSIQELFRYFKERKTGFKNEIRGLSDAQIEELAKLLPQPLPDDHRFFLREVGYDSGTMFAGEKKSYSNPSAFTSSALNYDFTAPAIEKHYRWLLGKRERNADIVKQNRFNDSFVFIGTQRHSEDHGSYYLDFRAGGEPSVANIDEDNEIIPLATSFKDFIFEYAFSGKSF